MLVAAVSCLLPVSILAAEDRIDAWPPVDASPPTKKPIPIPASLTLREVTENNNRVFALTFGSFTAHLIEDTADTETGFARGYSDDTRDEVEGESAATLLTAPGGGVMLNVAFTRSTDGTLNITYANGLAMDTNAGHYELGLDERTGTIVATISASHATTRRRLGWHKYKCHQGGRYTFRIVAVLDRGFYNQCGGTDAAATNKMKELFALASVPWEHNFGIKLGISKLILPGGEFKHSLLEEKPANRPPTTDGLYYCQNRWTMETRKNALDSFREGIAKHYGGLWLLFTDCGPRKMLEGKMFYYGVSGTAEGTPQMCNGGTGAPTAVVRWSQQTSNTLAHEVGHTFGAGHTFDGSKAGRPMTLPKKSGAGIMDYADTDVWDGEAQFHSMHETRVCDVILQSLRIEKTKLFGKFRSVLLDKDVCWDDNERTITSTTTKTTSVSSSPTPPRDPTTSQTTTSTTTTTTSVASSSTAGTDPTTSKTTTTTSTSAPSSPTPAPDHNTDDEKGKEDSFTTILIFLLLGAFLAAVAITSLWFYCRRSAQHKADETPPVNTQFTTKSEWKAKQERKERKHPRRKQEKRRKPNCVTVPEERKKVDSRE